MIELIISTTIGSFIGCILALALDRTYNEIVFRRLEVMVEKVEEE